MPTLADLYNQGNPADSISASPVVNPRMMKISQLLQTGKDFANKVQIPNAVPLLGGQRLGDLVMGKAPQEFENWGYGNAPYRVPEMSNIPQLKTGRADPFFDALMMLPFQGSGAGGAEKAGMVAVKSKNLKRVEEWAELGLFPYDTGITKNTINQMKQVTRNAPKLSEDTRLHRVVLDPADIEELQGLKVGDAYRPGRLLSTSMNHDSMPEIDLALRHATNHEGQSFNVKILAPKGTRIGGQLPNTDKNYGSYGEFLIHPEASFEVLSRGLSGIELKALTDSEAALRNRIKLRDIGK